MAYVSPDVWFVKFFMSTVYGYTSMTLYQNGGRSLANVQSSAISLAQSIDNLSSCKVVGISFRKEVYQVSGKRPEAGSSVSIVGVFSDLQYIGSDYQLVHVAGLRQQYQISYPPFTFGEVDVLQIDVARFLGLLNSKFNVNRTGEQLTYDTGNFVLNAIGVTGKDLPTI